MTQSHRDALEEVVGVVVHKRKFVDRKTSAHLEFVSSQESSCSKIENR